MVKSRRNLECEERINEEIVVDAYNESERWSGWHCYLEGRLKFPFQARCIKARDISPLRKGEMVEVIGMIENKTEDLPEMFVKIRWQGRALGVPLQQLEGVKVDAQTREAIGDWHYWCAQGRQF